MKSILSRALILGSFFLSLVAGQHNLFAVNFEDAITVRDGAFTNLMNSAKSRSWDGANTVPFGSVGPNNPIAEFVNTNEYLQYGSFNGPFNVTGQFLWEVTAYANVNNFGVLDLTTNSFTSLVPGLANPEFSFSQNFIGNDLYTFAFSTPAGFFHSQDSLDPSFPHIVGQRAIKDGVLTLNGKNFDVAIGDYFFYMEDLTNGFTDQDYNDQITLLRLTRTHSPEPATLVLFLMGLTAVIAFKKFSA